jgi:hypothetical protein
MPQHQLSESLPIPSQRRLDQSQIVRRHKHLLLTSLAREKFPEF